MFYPLRSSDERAAEQGGAGEHGLAPHGAARHPRHPHRRRPVVGGEQRRRARRRAGRQQRQAPRFAARRSLGGRAGSPRRPSHTRTRWAPEPRQHVFYEQHFAVPEQHHGAGRLLYGRRLEPPPARLGGRLALHVPGRVLWPPHGGAVEDVVQGGRGCPSRTMEWSTLAGTWLAVLGGAPPLRRVRPPDSARPVGPPSRPPPLRPR